MLMNANMPGNAAMRACKTEEVFPSCHTHQGQDTWYTGLLQGFHHSVASLREIRESAGMAAVGLSAFESVFLSLAL